MASSIHSWYETVVQETYLPVPLGSTSTTASTTASSSLTRSGSVPTSPSLCGSGSTAATSYPDPAADLAVTFQERLKCDEPISPGKQVGTEALGTLLNVYRQEKEARKDAEARLAMVEKQLLLTKKKLSDERLRVKRQRKRGDDLFKQTVQFGALVREFKEKNDDLEQRMDEMDIGENWQLTLLKKNLESVRARVKRESKRGDDLLRKNIQLEAIARCLEGENIKLKERNAELEDVKDTNEDEDSDSDSDQDSDGDSDNDTDSDVYFDC